MKIILTSTRTKMESQTNCWNEFLECIKGGGDISPGAPIQRDFRNNKYFDRNLISEIEKFYIIEPVDEEVKLPDSIEKFLGLDERNFYFQKYDMRNFYLSTSYICAVEKSNVKKDEQNNFNLFRDVLFTSYGLMKSVVRLAFVPGHSGDEKGSTFYCRNGDNILGITSDGDIVVTIPVHDREYSHTINYDPVKNWVLLATQYPGTTCYNTKGMIDRVFGLKFYDNIIYLKNGQIYVLLCYKLFVYNHDYVQVDKLFQGINNYVLFDYIFHDTVRDEVLGLGSDKKIYRVRDKKLLDTGVKIPDRDSVVTFDPVTERVVYTTDRNGEKFLVFRVLREEP